MRSLLAWSLVALAFLIGLGLVLWPHNHIADNVQASVLVQPVSGSGSGVVFKNGNDAFCWTDYHVVDDCFSWEGDKLVYKDVKLYQDVVQGGTSVGKKVFLAKILRMGPNDDLALLHLQDGNAIPKGVKFAKNPPRQGKSVYHVGSMHGFTGINSYCDGAVASVGRIRNARTNAPAELGKGVIFDQVSMSAHRGSSGGGVFDPWTGECIGLVSSFLDSERGGGFTYGAICIHPSRRIHEFAKRNNVPWASDDKVKVPSDLTPYFSNSIWDGGPPPKPKEAGVNDAVEKAFDELFKKGFDAPEFILPLPMPKPEPIQAPREQK